MTDDSVIIRTNDYSNVAVNVYEDGTITYLFDIEGSTNPCSEIELPNEEERKLMDDVKAMSIEERIQLYKSHKGIDKFNL